MQLIPVTEHKGAFFKVLAMTERSQVAVMTIGPGRDSGPEEIHDGDQIVYVIEGAAWVRVGTEEGEAKAGDLLVIPAGSSHHIYNAGERALFFLNIYAPPQY